MSKPKNWWWGNALRLIRAYPELQRKKQHQHQCQPEARHGCKDPGESGH